VRVDDFESRVRARAHRLWLLEGRPPGGADAYYDEARELVAIEENAAQARSAKTAQDREFYERMSRKWLDVAEHWRVIVDAR